jgi:hypothetical protein
MSSRSIFSSLALSTLVFLAACDSCDKKPEGAKDAGSSSTSGDGGGSVASAEGGAAASGDGGAMAAGGDGGAKHDMGNCPTSVAGAEVALKDVEGGIEVTVTGKDDAATKEIRDRMKKLGDADKQDAGPKQTHDHSGSGGGRTGRCTIIMRNTKLVTTEVPKGVKVVVTPNEKNELDWLRRETKQRAKEAQTAQAEGAGAHRMLHCPSAVEGAKTTVKDSKEGVTVTVTGTGDAVGEIRTRAKHTANVAKIADAGKPEHSGEGTGGGGIGRCPIVVEGDTTVDVKEIEGGVEVEVKTKKDVAALQKEAKLRAGNFPAK